MSLDRLLGTWDVSMQHVQLEQAVSGRHVYERLLDGAFVMLRGSMDHPDFPDAIAVIDDSAYYHFDVRGIARRFDLSWSGDTWSIIRRDPDFWQRQHTRLLSLDEMSATGENSYDGGATWEHDFTMTYTRVR